MGEYDCHKTMKRSKFPCTFQRILILTKYSTGDWESVLRPVEKEPSRQASWQGVVEQVQRHTVGPDVRSEGDRNKDHRVGKEEAAVPGPRVRRREEREVWYGLFLEGPDTSQSLHLIQWSVGSHWWLSLQLCQAKLSINSTLQLEWEGPEIALNSKTG